MRITGHMGSAHLMAKGELSIFCCLKSSEITLAGNNSKISTPIKFWMENKKCTGIYLRMCVYLYVGTHVCMNVHMYECVYVYTRVGD